MRNAFCSFLLLAGISLWNVCGTLQAVEYTWTGNGTDDRLTTKENWSENANLFAKNRFGLTHNSTNWNSHIIPEGASAVFTGFDITYANITLNGNVKSIRESYDTWKFNGFWMRGENTVTIGPNANFGFYAVDGKTPDAVQISLAGSNNTLNKYDSGTITIESPFISSFNDGAGSKNVMNQYAGSVITTSVFHVGDNSSSFTDENISKYNLYGGTVSAKGLCLNTVTNSRGTFNGRGEINVYGGSFTTETLEGGTSVKDGTNYLADINVHLGTASDAGYGTFSVTGASTYTGNLNVTADAPLMTADSSIVSANFLTLSAPAGTEKVQISTELVKRSDDEKFAALDASKNVNTTGKTYEVGDALTFTGTSAGFLTVGASEDPYAVNLFTSEFADQTALNAFTKWLNDSTDDYTVKGLNLFTVQISDFLAGGERTFLWDFSGYNDSAVLVSGLSSAALPEPASWLLLLAGTLEFCVFRKRR